MVDDVVRAILKLALCAFLSGLVFVGLSIWFVHELPPKQYPQYGNSYIMFPAAGAVAAFFVMAFKAFPKRKEKRDDQPPQT
jgi:hypothetical protein